MDKRIFLWLLFFGFLVELVACSTVSKDGPPSYYVDENKIPDAVPKVEPLAKYGNMSSYKVYGRQYHVMPSSHGYEARGVASWYGTKFHSHNTSSGEPYNMLAMTAAHKTLPLPSYVEVTNLNNGRKVIVKVNDRGPFEGNRLIDLSYVAAKKLGMIGHGTTRVEVKSIDPRDAVRYSTMLASKKKVVVQTVAKSKTTHFVSNHVYLQVGAFREKSHAQRLQQRLTSLTQTPVHIKSSQQLYRVQMGPFKDVAEVDRISKRLKSAGISLNNTHKLLHG